MVKKGFTLLELVIAIVVISIALMSVPLLLSQASESDEFNINQEAILAGATEMGDILTYPWNESNASQILQVFDVTDGDIELNRSHADNNRRIGHFKEKYRRKFYDDTTESNSTLGHDKGDEFNDIDDFNGEITSVSSGGTGDYLKDLNLSIGISYISDDANYSHTTLNLGELNISSVQTYSDPNATTNIKMIEINVSDNNHNPITTLRAFSTNIGSYELLYRTLQ